MAAFDTPWTMSSTPGSNQRDTNRGSAGLDGHDAHTTAAFSPVNLSNSCSTNKQRSLILIPQKSSLLISTPPQITRVLACSHFFLLPLNELVGLLTWTSGDPWESFLLLVTFWTIVLYGDVLISYAAPPIISIFLSLCVYSRRYSTIPFTFLTRKDKSRKQKKKLNSESSDVKHQKTLEDIVETLRTFTHRCHILFNPFLDFIDFLESQRSKSMSKKLLPKSLLFRILLIGIIWIALNLKPIQVITTKRSILFLGTLLLTWHSRPNRVARAILWRSSIIRRSCTIVTGLPLEIQPSCSDLVQNINSTSPSLEKKPLNLESTSSSHSLLTQHLPDALDVRFTFSLYENQRRWVGLGWTTNLFAYERAAWTDEHQNPMPPKEQFQLPHTEDTSMTWKWVDGSTWLVEGAGETDEEGVQASDDSNAGMGWIYYDNKWQQGRRGLDGWWCYTRRRKWYRDAELVEVSPSKTK